MTFHQSSQGLQVFTSFSLLCSDRGQKLTTSLEKFEKFVSRWSEARKTDSSEHIGALEEAEKVMLEQEVALGKAIEVHYDSEVFSILLILPLTLFRFLLWAPIAVKLMHLPSP